MGVTVQQLGQIMTAKEFGQHFALEQHEPLPAAQWSAVAKLLASQANGPLQAPEAGRNWCASDFMPARWQEVEDDAAPQAEQVMTVKQIMDQARAAGMV